MIRIKSFQAKNGDAFLISFGKNKKHNIMIDMGMPSTYEDSIKEELTELSKKRQIDLLVITHMHRDHIGGALEFIKDNGKNHDIIKVNEVWHNSYKHLHFDKIEKKDDKETIECVKDIIYRYRENYKPNGVQKISAEEGTSFAGNLLMHKYNWNSSFKENAIVVDTNIPKKIGENINIILLSPNRKKLNVLSKEWEKELKGKQLSKNHIFDDAFEFYMQNDPLLDTYLSNIGASKKYDYEELAKEEKTEKDGSITNGSSIAFIVEYTKKEEVKKMLFLGDAHEDIIYENLKILKDKGYDLNFELVKVSHHGGLKNSSNRLFSMIDSKRFLISTNGNSHGHPDIKTLAKIITKKTNYIKEIIFNHEDIETLKELKKDSKNLKDKYNVKVKFLEEIKL